MQDNDTRLRRSISLPLLVAYGTGTMVGGGFYGLLGKVAGHAGMHLPLALLVSAAVAVLTALSFGELSSRLPVSAGESRYVDAAFGHRWLSIIVGWGVIATGVVSAATLIRIFVGFLRDLIDIPASLGILLLLLALVAVSIRGILASVLVASLITVIEVGGLCWVLSVNGRSLATLAERGPELIPPLVWNEWSGIFWGAFLAFYAFIGFEDMVNEAEEVQDPRRNLPLGIMLALLVTTVLYVLVGLVAVLAVDPGELAESNTPLALLVANQGHTARVLMTVISMIAGVNGALVQLIMSSRVAYGMSDHQMGPRFLAQVHPKFRTPAQATLSMGLIILVLTLWLPLEMLARVTSAIMLCNFALVNASLASMKFTKREVPERCVQVPVIVPIVGCVLCLLFLGIQLCAGPG